MKTRKAQEFGVGIYTIIAIIIGLLVVLIALWLGSKTTGVGKFVTDAIV